MTTCFTCNHNSVQMTSNKGRSLKTGVSLLEVLVSMTLAMVMLSSVWSLTSILTRRFESHLQLSETNQMIRSLHQQWASDFNNLIRNQSSSTVATPVVITPAVVTPIDPFAGSSESSTLDMAGLQGSPTSPGFPIDSSSQQFNQFDLESSAEILPFANPTTVLRGGPDQMTLITFTAPVDLMLQRLRLQLLSESDARLTEDQPIRSGNFKTIRYFKTPNLSDEHDHGDDFEFDAPKTDSIDVSTFDSGTFDSDRSVRWVLTREETEFFPLSVFADSSASFFTEANEFENNRSTPSDQRANQQMINAPQWRRVDSITEVTEFRFSYFDGFVWSSTWNSDHERHLPQAIKVDFNLTRAQRKTGFERTDELGREPELRSPLKFPTDEDFNTELSDLDTTDWNNLDPGQKLFQHSFIFCIGPVKNRSAASREFNQSPQLNPSPGRPQGQSMDPVPVGPNNWSQE